MATAEGKAGQIHGIVGAAEEVAGTIADRIQALDRIAILIKHLHLAIDVHAMDDGRQTNVTMDAVEGGLLDRLQPLGRLAHIFVNTGIDKLVVASNRLHERVHVSKAKLLAEFLDGVRLESRSQIGVHALLLARLLRHVRLNSLGVIELARPVSAVGHIIRIKHLRVIAVVLFARKEVAVVGHGATCLIAEAGAVIFHSQERHVGHRARARVEVMLHLGAAYALHAAASPYHHLLAIASLIGLLAIKMIHVGVVVGHHLIIVGIVARRDNNAVFRIELHVIAAVFADDAHDLIAVFHELLSRAGIENLKPVFAVVVIAQIAHAATGVVRFRAEIKCEIRNRLLVDNRDVARPFLGGVNDLAASFGRLIPQPMQSFAGIACPQLELIAVRTPRALLGEPRHHSRLAGGTRGGLERVARIALRNRLALFLNKRNLRACIGRGQRARHTCGACANYDHVKFLGLLDVFNGFGSLEEARQTVGIFRSGSRSALRRSARRRAAREHACAGRSNGCDAAEFKQIAT